MVNPESPSKSGATGATLSSMRELWRWHSPAMGRELGVARWGHFGKPLILFPTGGGDFLDVERFLLVRALQPLIDAGRIKVYAVDSPCRQGWVPQEVSPPEKVRWQVRYAQYLEQELFPLIRTDCGDSDQPMAVAGASLGAYQAWTAAGRHPDRIDLCIGMSGTYVVDRRLKGHWEPDWYYHDPKQFIARMPEGRDLELLRRGRFILALGERYENEEYTRIAADTLRSKRIPVDVVRWASPAGHDWPTWRTMLPRFLDASLG